MRISGSNINWYFIVGDPAGDGYPGAGAGTSVAVSGVWKAHAASAYQGAEEQRDWERTHVYSQRPVYLQTAQGQNPDR